MEGEIESLLLPKPDGPFGGRGVNHHTFLENFDLATCNEAAGGLAGLFHVIAPLILREDGASGFARADCGLICSLIQKSQDGLFEFSIKSLGF